MKTLSSLKSTLCLVLLLLVSAGCSQMSMGNVGAKTTATGAAGGSYSENANPNLPRCEQSLGTLAVLEDSSADWYAYMRGYGIQSVTPILRLLAQQSNCFTVVERGRGMKSMNRERELAKSGELRKGSNFGKGLMAAADYSVTPTLIFSANTGGGGAWLDNVLPSGISKWTKMRGNMNVKDAQSLLALVDNRSGVQVGIAEGSGRSYDFGGLMDLFSLFGGRTSGGLDAYSRTPQGKVIVASLTDAYINLVRVVMQYRPQNAAGPGGHGTGGKLKVY